jgi:hypothetical protein
MNTGAPFLVTVLLMMFGVGKNKCQFWVRCTQTAHWLLDDAQLKWPKSFTVSDYTIAHYSTANPLKYRLIVEST